jgi:hypothetical protein
LHGGNLREDVDAIAIVFEHLPDSAHLSLDAAEASRQLGFAGRVTRDARMLWGDRSRRLLTQ